MKTPRRLLLWDFDGVILDSFTVVAQTIIFTAEKYNLPIITENHVRKLYKTNFFDGLASYDMSEKEISQFVEDQTKKAELERKSMMLYPGIKILLEKLKQTTCMAIVSSGRYRDIDYFLKKNDIRNLFFSILGSESGHSKAEKIKQAARQMSISPKYVYYIGDTMGDINEGKEAGVVTIGVTWGYHTKEMLATTNPHYLARNVQELENILAN